MSTEKHPTRIRRRTASEVKVANILRHLQSSLDEAMEEGMSSEVRMAIKEVHAVIKLNDGGIFDATISTTRKIK